MVRCSSWASRCASSRASWRETTTCRSPAALDEILGLRARGLRSAVILPLGYRQPEGDWLVNLQKVRRPRSAFITEV